VTLLRDPTRRNYLAQMGRKLVEERYSWQQVAREFEIKCEEVINAR
jgi:glycosyltransferase involved in cell wall biosynthesis